MIQNSVITKSMVERYLSLYKNTSNLARKYFYLFNTYLLSSIFLEQEDKKHIQEINYYYNQYYKAVLRGSDHRKYENVLEQFKLKDLEIINKYLEYSKDETLETSFEEQYLMESIEGAIGTEISQPDYIFDSYLPPHMHEEEGYNFYKIYEKSFELVSYDKLIKAMSNVQEAERKLSKERSESTIPKKESKEIKEDPERAKRAYELKKSEDLTWEEIGKDPLIKCGYKQAKKLALEYAQKNDDKDFIIKYIKQRKRSHQ